MLQFLALMLVAQCGEMLRAEEESYSAGFEPPHAANWPATFKEYQILPYGIAPNGKYALCYPKRSVLLEVKRPRLYLITLEPFEVMSEIPCEGLLAVGHGYYAVNWAADSSAVIVIEGQKWGPNKVFLIPVRAGGASRAIDLTAKVRALLASSFKAAGVRRYNNNYDFIFESTKVGLNQDGSALREVGWDFNDRGEVVIRCLCTTDPKDMDGPSWTARFEGVWDIANRRFNSHTVTPIRHADAFAP